MIEIVLIRKLHCEVCDASCLWPIDDPLPKKCKACGTTAWIYGRNPKSVEIIRQGIAKTGKILTKDVLRSKWGRETVSKRWARPGSRERASRGHFDQHSAGNVLGGSDVQRRDRP